MSPSRLQTNEKCCRYGNISTYFCKILIQINNSDPTIDLFRKLSSTKKEKSKTWFFTNTYKDYQERDIFCT